MLFHGVSHNTGDPAPYLQAEGARIDELHKAGLIEMVLLKADQSGAVVLLRADSLAAAREAVDSLPLAVNGITSFELTEVIDPGLIAGSPAPQPAP